MAGIQLSGLVSGSFDWQSVVDQLIKVDSQPVANLQTEQATNNNQIASLAQLKSGLTDLQTAVQGLQADGLFTGRSAVSTTPNSTWTSTAANSAATGSYRIAVTQLASAATRLGSTGVSAGLSATDDVTGLTMATLSTATPVTAGTFTVNGQPVTFALTDSLAQVFQKISDATGGTVTASYDHATDKITLASGDNSEVILGAANDSSNFLSALRLANNGGSSITSASKLGSAALTVPLINAHLKNPISAVDGTGKGTLNINGVGIDYNVNTDSLSDVMNRINASGAGVTASYDAASDRFVLTNQSTGDTGIGANETTGGLLDALGLTSGSTLQHGQNAHFSINGGGQLSSTSNVLDGTALGVPGLSVTVNDQSTQTISVTPNSAAMKTAIQSFIDNYNTVQTFIDAQTTITKNADGTPQTAILSGNHEVQAWAQKMRNLAFNQVPGLSGTVKQLADLGIDFDSINNKLVVKDETKLDNALSNTTTDVGSYFGNATGGFAQQFNSFLTDTLALNGSLASQTATLNRSNTTMQAQIDTLNKRLADEKDQLTQSFLAMQTAQSNAATQQQLLNSMFNTTSTKTTTTAS